MISLIFVTSGIIQQFQKSDQGVQLTKFLLCNLVRSSGQVCPKYFWPGLLAQYALYWVVQLQCLYNIVLSVLVLAKKSETTSQSGPCNAERQRQSAAVLFQLLRATFGLSFGQPRECRSWCGASFDDFFFSFFFCPSLTV